MRNLCIFILSVCFLLPAFPLGHAEELPVAQAERILVGQPGKVLHFEHVHDKNISFQGRIVVSARIDKDGHVASTRIMASSGSMLLDRMACHIVMERWKFAPATDVHGQPMISDMMCAVYFNMNPKQFKKRSAQAAQ